ncbi:helix-turn-helix transcriptional regulator [Gilvimarinus agarilyticus]|nr:helix-turn-helix transcriptional regulator [Gilvimarinus agarilyticus]
MSQIPHLCGALKSMLKSRGVTYRDLAAALSMSEANIKRMFAQQSISLQRLEAICQVLGLSLTDFIAQCETKERSITQLTDEQELELASDIKLCLVAVCLRDGWTYYDIVEHYQISEHECIQLLARLDRLKLIELLPGNAFKVLISPNVRWTPGGPLDRFIAGDVIGHFLQGSFREPESFRFYLRGSFTQSSIEHLQNKLEQLTLEAEEMNRQDARIPLDKRTHIGILLAMRPWELSAFRALRRPS